MSIEEAERWFETINESDFLKEFKLTFKIKSLEHMENIRKLIYRFQKNGWQEWSTDMEQHIDGRFMSIEMKRSAYSF